LFTEFAHERDGHSGSARRSITARDEGSPDIQGAEDVFRATVTSCVRPVLHRIVQRKPLRAMQPLL